MKFSVIVPVYNVEKYLANCLDSILKQTYNDFEIVIVNDGSPDNSQQIIDEYAKNHPEKIKAYVKENGGLSDARNFGIERATGEYLMFIDSDDYISLGLLEALNHKLCEKAVDVIRFSAQVVFENGEKGETIFFPGTDAISGVEALNKLIDNKQYFEPAPFYAYKREFWKQNGFSFAVGRYHEDFGLIPQVIMKADSFSSVDDIGYFYVQTASSIIRGTNYEKDVIKANDIQFHSLNHIRFVKKYLENDEVKNKFLSYIANAVIAQSNKLNGADKKKYIQVLKREKIFDMLLQNTLKRKVKRICIKIKYGAF